MTDEQFAEIPIECPHCKAKQKVRVTGRTGFSQMAGPQTIQCIKCKKDFEKSIPDTIVGGPFPA
jgi:hypothetical protein